MRTLIIAFTFMFLFGCSNSPRSMDYYLSEIESENKIKNKDKMAKLEELSSQNGCELFWHRIRGDKIKKLDQIKNGQICLDLKNQIYSMPTVYLSSDQIAFPKMHKNLKILIASMQDRLIPLRDGIAEFNDLYDAYINLADNEISDSNEIVAKGERDFANYQDQINKKNAYLQDFVRKNSPKIYTTTCSYNELLRQSECVTY